jgi:hypothetical protein
MQVSDVVLNSFSYFLSIWNNLLLITYTADEKELITTIAAMHNILRAGERR